MRALIQSTVAWVNQKITAKTQHEESEVTKATPTIALVTTPSPVAKSSKPVLKTPVEPTPSAPKAKRVSSIQEETVPFQQVITNEGPELVLSNKGSKIYGTCPHCSATWSVAERLMHPRFQRLEKSKGLTCPACDKSVSLPASAGLHKPS